VTSRTSNAIIRVLLALAVLSGLSYAQTADRDATQQTKQILLYLKGLNRGSSRRTISGHQLNTQYPPVASFDSAITKIYKKTGTWVGLIGIDYQRVQKGPMRSMSVTNTPLVEYFRTGGLVSVMCSFTNPWTDGTMNDSTNRHKLFELIVPGNAGAAAWMQRLDSVAAGLRQLQDSGVTVLFRPLHEMNGQWFWWGSQSTTSPLKQDWVGVWRHMFTYFTQTKGLHNLLWVFSPSSRNSSISNPAFRADTAFYPGSEYVDIVGVDVYDDTLDIPFYDALRSTGKPFALCEFGPGLHSADTPYRYDYRILMQQIRSKYPDIVYWMSWNDFGSSVGSRYYGLTSQNYVSELLNDPWVINRDKLAWRNVTNIEREQAMKPGTFELSQNYPNPFNPSTALSYQLSALSRVNLKIYNLLGQEVASLADGDRLAGYHQETWDATRFASGMYVYQLIATDEHGTRQIARKRMLLLK